MKAKSLSFLSSFVALLFAGSIVHTLGATANIAFTEIVPPPGQTIVNDPTRFAAKVVDQGGFAIKEVKLLYRVRGSGSKYLKSTLVQEANNVWARQIDLNPGAWEWYLEAKNTKKAKMVSSTFTFTLVGKITVRIFVAKRN